MASVEPTHLTAEVVSFAEIHELPGDWSPAVLRGLLSDLDFEAGDASDGDLLDLAQMALGDLDRHVAGMAVLKAVFGETMASGVRSNLSSDLESDRPWEDFADLSRHAGIFTSVVLLQKAFPKFYGKPDAVRVEVAFKLTAEDDVPRLLRASAAALLRALAPGLGERSIVTRLYAEGLSAGEFPEAAHILWRWELRIDPSDPRRVLAVLHGGQSFLGTLDEAQPWPVTVELETGE